MVLERRSQSVDSIERRRRHVIERAPVIGNEVFRLQPLEQRKRIVAGQMPFTKTWLPPGSMADWQKGQIEMSSFGEKLPLHHMGCVRHQRGIPGEEA